MVLNRRHQSNRTWHRKAIVQTWVFCLSKLNGNNSKVYFSPAIHHYSKATSCLFIKHLVWYACVVNMTKCLLVVVVVQSLWFLCAQQKWNILYVLWPRSHPTSKMCSLYWATKCQHTRNVTATQRCAWERERERDSESEPEEVTDKICWVLPRDRVKANIADVAGQNKCALDKLW